jgi:hypothetical protein
MELIGHGMIGHGADRPWNDNPVGDLIRYVRKEFYPHQLDFLRCDIIFLQCMKCFIEGIGFGTHEIFIDLVLDAFIYGFQAILDIEFGTTADNDIQLFNEIIPFQVIGALNILQGILRSMD